MIELHISERLKKRLPSLTEEELRQLTQNIKEDGEVLDPILYWYDGKKNVILDGMNRFAIAKSGNLAFQAKEIVLSANGKASYEDAEIWILNHQLGRRNVLDPHAIRKIRGELYNLLKRKDGGHGDQRSVHQNDGPKRRAAEEVAEKSGVSPATVERDGARVKAIAGLSRAAKAVAEKASDAEVKRLSKLPKSSQDSVARAVRTGQAKSVSEALKQAGKDLDSEGTPEESSSRSPRNGKDKPTASTPPKQFDKRGCFKQWEQAIGPVVRLVDKIAASAGEKGCDAHERIQAMLESCTTEMAKWMGVKK